MELFIKNWVKIAISSIVITAYVSGALVYGLMPSPKCEELFGEKYYQRTGYSIRETGYNGGIIFYHGQFNWTFLFALGSFTVLIFISAGIIFIAALKTSRRLKTFSSESQAVANQQKRIFTLLIFQARWSLK